MILFWCNISRRNISVTLSTNINGHSLDRLCALNSIYYYINTYFKVIPSCYGARSRDCEIPNRNSFRLVRVGDNQYICFRSAIFSHWLPYVCVLRDVINLYVLSGSWASSRAHNLNPLSRLEPTPLWRYVYNLTHRRKLRWQLFLQKKFERAMLPLIFSIN